MTRLSIFQWVFFLIVFPNGAFSLLFFPFTDLLGIFTASTRMGIPALIDAFDMVGDPDELSLMTYACS